MEVSSENFKLYFFFFFFKKSNKGCITIVDLEGVKHLLTLVLPFDAQVGSFTLWDTKEPLNIFKWC